MVRNMCHVFVGGPPLVKSAFGEERTKEELGGYLLHTRQTGVVDNDAIDEQDALDQVRQFLSYLPANVWEMPTRNEEATDAPGRKEMGLRSIIPRNNRKPYDMRALLGLVLDRDSIFEIGRYQGRSQITALARLNGYPVGVLANDPNFLGGSFNYDVAEKFQRFIDMCDTFHLPSSTSSTSRVSPSVCKANSKAPSAKASGPVSPSSRQPCRWPSSTSENASAWPAARRKAACD